MDDSSMKIGGKRSEVKLTCSIFFSYENESSP